MGNGVGKTVLSGEQLAGLNIARVRFPFERIFLGRAKKDFQPKNIDQEYMSRMLPDVFHIISNVCKYLLQDYKNVRESPLDLLIRLLVDKSHGQSQFFESLIEHRKTLLKFISWSNENDNGKRPHHPMFLGGAVHIVFDVAAAFFLRIWEQVNLTSEKWRSLYKVLFNFFRIQSALIVLFKHRTRSAALKDEQLGEFWSATPAPLNPPDRCAALVLFCSMC